MKVFWKRGRLRALSYILTLVVALSAFLPVLAAAGADTQTQTINFRTPKLSNDYPERIGSTNNFNIAGITYEDTQEMWQWGASNQEAASGVFMLARNSNLRTNLKAGNWVALEISIEHSGIQKWTFHSALYRTGGTAQAFLIPQTNPKMTEQEIEEACAGAESFGTLQCYDADAAAVTDAPGIELGSVSVEEPGAYLLVFKMSKAGYLFLKELTMQTVKEPEQMELTAQLPANFVEIGGRARLALFNGTEEVALSDFHFTSENPEIATVSPDGYVTGVSIGRAVVRAEGLGESVSVEVPVVGENLLTREGVQNGSFAGQMLHGVRDDNQYWEVVKSGEYMGDDSIYGFEVSERSSFLHERIPVMRLSANKKAPSGAMRFSFRSDYSEPKAGVQRGGHVLEADKIYELSGWAKAENAESPNSLNNGLNVRLFYYGKNEKGAYKLISEATSGTAVTPWLKRTGNQDWTYFATLPLSNDEFSGQQVLLQPRIEGSMLANSNGWICDLYFADLSLHEVQYDRLAFEAEAELTELEAGQTVSTAVTHWTTTGQELKKIAVNTGSGTLPAPVAVEAIPVRYASSDENVARVSAGGVITAVGGGEATVTASATAGGITREESLKVTVAGAPASRELESVSIRFTPNPVRAGEEAAVTVEGRMSDGQPAYLEDASIEYDYDETMVAYHSERASFTGLRAGDAAIGVTVTLDGVSRQTTGILSVAPAALQQVALRYDRDTISVGESIQPSISALLTDGREADLSGASIRYQSSAPQVLEVDAVTGAARGLNRGSAEVTVQVILEGVEKTASQHIRVVPGSVESAGVRVTHNLMTRNTAWSALEAGNNANDIRGITEDYTDGWTLHSWGGGVAPAETTFYHYNNSYLRMAMNRIGNWAALKIHLPEAGRYRSILQYCQYSSAGAADVYLVPADVSDVQAYLTDEWKLGSFDALDESASSVVDTTLRLDDAIIERPGDYLVVFRMTRVSGGRYLFLKKLTFSGASPITGISTSPSSNALSLGETTQLDVGIEWEAPLEEYKQDLALNYRNLSPELIELTPDGMVTALARGVAKIEIAASCMGYTEVGACYITVESGKSRRSLYTDEKVENARRNIERYDWAASMRDAAVREADKYVENIDRLRALLPTQELLRSFKVGYIDDPGQNTCVFCEKDLLGEYGAYPWITDPMRMPWKIQCPNCRRQFPSNDFGSFYELGLDQHGNWSYQQAHAKNAELVAAGKDGFLTNISFPEKKDAQWGDRWGVDDGWGFKIGDECKSFIGYYHYSGIWSKLALNSLESLTNAYLYTGESKYGRAGLLLLDRMADLYPDFDATASGEKFGLSNGGSKPSRGKILGRIADRGLALQFTESYDALWPMTFDPQVLSYTSQKAAQYQFANPKSTQQELANHLENNLLREINRSVRDLRIHSNFGHHQLVLLSAAVALDTMPETKEWIDFTFQSGGRESNTLFTGGNVYAQLVDTVDRDGHGNEAAAGYNAGWLARSCSIWRTYSRDTTVIQRRIWKSILSSYAC